jgi:hypothetical protein
MTDHKYLLRKPRAVPEGRVLVHNHIDPVGPKEPIGTRWFRIWLEPAPPSERLAECGCGWAPELGVHYRVAAKAPPDGEAARRP